MDLNSWALEDSGPAPDHWEPSTIAFCWYSPRWGGGQSSQPEEYILSVASEGGPVDTHPHLPGMSSKSKSESLKRKRNQREWQTKGRFSCLFEMEAVLCVLSFLSVELLVFPELPGQVSRPNVSISSLKMNKHRISVFFLTYLALAKIQ